MAAAEISCGKCGGAMQAGYIPDAAGMVFRRSAWVEADEVAHTALRQLSDPAMASYWLTAYRCGACGFVELYANDKQDDGIV
jgi:hypothetical protein